MLGAYEPTVRVRICTTISQAYIENGGILRCDFMLDGRLLQTLRCILLTTYAAWKGVTLQAPFGMGFGSSLFLLTYPNWSFPSFLSPYNKLWDSISIMPAPLASKSFKIHHSLIILWFITMFYDSYWQRRETSHINDVLDDLNLLPPIFSWYSKADPSDCSSESQQYFLKWPLNDSGYGLNESLLFSLIFDMSHSLSR